MHEGRRPDGTLTRWTFKDIHSDACTWIGEGSQDGQNWRREAEFRLRRRSSGA